MRIGLIAQGAEKAICEHTKEVVLGIDDLTEAVLVEYPGTYVPDLPSINTCLAVRNMKAQPKLEEMFQSELGVVNSTIDSFLYGFFNGKNFSDLLEVSYSTRFMAGDIGASIGFVQGTAIPATNEVFAAFPELTQIQTGLNEIEYRGEITLGCTRDFHISDIKFGHQTGLFALFTELSQLAPQANYEWCLGIGHECKVHEDGISVCTLISNPPFPVPTSETVPLIAPVGAEKHLYRVNAMSHEVAYVATWGVDLVEAKRRTRRTIENCVSFNPNLQYRYDYGYKERFVFSQEKYQKLGGQ